MDYQNRPGAKHGGGGMATKSETERQRQQRVKKLMALEKIDLDNDPYIERNNLTGTFECKLCSTPHSNESAYLAHTQSKRHSLNLMRRDAAFRKKEKQQMGLQNKQNVKVKKLRKVDRIGNPGYKISKVRDPGTSQVGLLFQIKYPEIGTGVKPMHRFMSAYEQQQENPDPSYQYLLVAAEPYNTCAFKIEAREIDNDKGKFWTFFDRDTKEYFLQFLYKD